MTQRIKNHLDIFLSSLFFVRKKYFENYSLKLREKNSIKIIMIIMP